MQVFDADVSSLRCSPVSEDVRGSKPVIVSLIKASQTRCHLGYWKILSLPSGRTVMVDC